MKANGAIFSSDQFFRTQRPTGTRTGRCVERKWALGSQSYVTLLFTLSFYFYTQIIFVACMCITFRFVLGLLITWCCYCSYNVAFEYRYHQVTLTNIPCIFIPCLFSLDVNLNTSDTPMVMDPYQQLNELFRLLEREGNLLGREIDVSTLSSLFSLNCVLILSY